MKARDVLTGAAISGAVIYLLDPSRGRRRRAFMQEKMIHASHRIANAAENTSRDLANRAKGIFSRGVGLFHRKAAGDEILEERIRAQLGRYVSHPGSIEVQVRDGDAVLSGPILKAEVDRTLEAVNKVKGIRHVEDKLEVHDEPGNVPGLQGGSSTRQPRFELAQENWSPTARLLMGGAGTSLAIGSLLRWKWAGLPLSAAGGLIVARSVMNIPMRRLTGIGAKRLAVHFDKTLTINAPVQRVFEFWSSFENFPKFMTHVREVRKTEAENQWHWTVEGPAGFPVEWNAEVTQYKPNEVIAWKTFPDSPIQHAGLVRFNPTSDNATQIQLRFSYNPTAGAIGHAIAKLFGADPKKEMEDDLVRVKTFLESGKVAHDAAQKAL